MSDTYMASIGYMWDRDPYIESRRKARSKRVVYSENRTEQQCDYCDMLMRQPHSGNAKSAWAWCIYWEATLELDAAIREEPWSFSEPTPARNHSNRSEVERIRLDSQKYWATLPPILLSGMYGAVAFALLSVGPAWLGFVLGAGAVSGVTALAFLNLHR